MNFVLPVAVATKNDKKGVITLTGDKGNMYRQLQDKLGVEDTTESIALVEVNPDSLLGKLVEDNYYYDDEGGLLDLNAIVERLNKFNNFTEIYEDILDTSEIDGEFSDKVFYDFDDYGMNEIFNLLGRDPMNLAKAIYNSPNFHWTDSYIYYSDTGHIGTSNDNVGLDFSDKDLQEAIIEAWLKEA